MGEDYTINLIASGELACKSCTNCSHCAVCGIYDALAETTAVMDDYGELELGYEVSLFRVLAKNCRQYKHDD